MSTVIEELVFASGEVDIQATGKLPAVNIVAYTGGLMTVPGWGELQNMHGVIHVLAARLRGLTKELLSLRTPSRDFR